MVKIKICGITNLEDALLAAELGADALGFIFYKKSPRRVEEEKVRKIVSDLPPFVTKVGVFVNEQKGKIEEIMDLCALDVVQLHGQETPDQCRELKYPVIKGFSLRSSEDIKKLNAYLGKTKAFLLDTYDPQKAGGTGRIFNWDWAVEAKKLSCPLILSGGLTPENVGEAIDKVRPYAVDVASGVEAFPGKKDPQKLRVFIEAAKAF